MNNKETIFDGRPSIVLNQRPFFSIIIPCYNSGKTLGSLLESIVKQDMSNEIEVILADDCSPESYQDVVEQYNDKLSIRQIKTDYNFAPGNTREKGVSIAEGEWVCFADHDDEFIPETLKEIKNNIIESGEDQFVVANFIEMDPNSGQVLKTMERTRNWMHAKFYNLDNFWKKYGIHFKKDLLTHEDICVSSQINCAVCLSGKEPTYLDIYCYIWMSRPTSISREKYGNHSFIEVFFKDYIISTGYTYLEKYKNSYIDKTFIYVSVIDVLLYCYFYLQGFKFHHPTDWIRDNEQHAREYFVLIKETFGITNQDVYEYVSINDAEMYMSVKEYAHIGVGPFIESELFVDWMDKLHKDFKQKNRETMSDVIRKENM